MEIFLTIESFVIELQTKIFDFLFRVPSLLRVCISLSHTRNNLRLINSYQFSFSLDFFASSRDIISPQRTLIRGNWKADFFAERDGTTPFLPGR